MKNRFKILGLFLSVLFFIAVLMTAVFAVEFSADALLSGSCGEGSTVYWEILPNDEGKYTMNIFGEGAFKNLTPEGNNVGYSNPDACAWNEYRLDITKVIIGDGITVLSYGSFIHHKALHTIELGASISSFDTAAMEGCDALKTIYRRGNEPEIGTFDLRGITYFGGYLFDGCRYVQKILLPEEGKYRLNLEFLKNNEALKEIYIPKACTDVSSLAFSSCSALKNVYIEGDTVLHDNFNESKNYTVHAFENCPGGLTISAKTGTPAHLYATEHSTYVLYEGTENEKTRTMNYQSPFVVSVYDNGENILDIEAVKGFYIDCLVEKNGTYVLFEDEERTKLISDVAITGDMDIEGTKLFDFVGFMVRTADYNGLRAIYNYDCKALASLASHKVKEMGVLGAKYYGIDPVLDLGFHHGSKTVIWEGGELVGKLIEAPRNGIYTFANTAVGYEDEAGNAVETRVASEILTRAYVIIQDNETGEEKVFYSEQNKKDLTSACEATKEAGEGILGSDQVSFIDSLIALGADPGYMYTKEEAYEHLTRMYNDTEHILSGQHISYSFTT
ncbi:MAG: leucine-rich repeat protein, partial [Clostridia bacterium]|nr:leucine-rich repeat protein [Clostridia bacterium]